jgi:hypothetical protein
MSVGSGFEEKGVRETLIYSYFVIPAKAGIQSAFWHFHSFLDPRLRGDDAVEGTLELFGISSTDLIIGSFFGDLHVVDV